MSVPVSTASTESATPEEIATYNQANEIVKIMAGLHTDDFKKRHIAKAVLAMATERWREEVHRVLRSGAALSYLANMGLGGNADNGAVPETIMEVLLETRRFTDTLFNINNATAGFADHSDAPAPGTPDVMVHTRRAVFGILGADERAGWATDAPKRRRVEHLISEERLRARRAAAWGDD
jgi:hypothetical protein